MAGDWIKIEHTLPDKPEVSRVADILGISEDEVVGKLVRLWIWADQHTSDGHAVSVTKMTLDRRASCPGLADALRQVGWLEGRDAALSFPNFVRHNGQSAKKRAQARDRKDAERSRGSDDESRTCHAPSVTKTRPEKRREENKSERESADPLEQEPESVRALESVIAAYPKNGNAMEARRALALLNLSVPELHALREKVAVLAARMAALPESERRYCPAKHTFFQERRWEDDPGGTPWIVAASSPAAPPAAPSKPYHNKWKSLNQS